MRMVESFSKLTDAAARELEVRAGAIFQPRTPITTRGLFAGRWSQLTTLADAVGQPGLHVVIYGERGVGKTSLSNIVKPLIHLFDERDGAQFEDARLVVKTNANKADNFSAIWAKLFDEITWEQDRPTVGIIPGKKRVPILQAFQIDWPLRVGDVRRVVSHIPGALFIIDEFDRAAGVTAQDFTDLLKELSDFAVNCTVILVGVSHTVDTLIADHASISRALVQIMLPRMEVKELREILANAEKRLSVTFAEQAARLIVNISQGLPHYTHLLGLHSVRISARRNSGIIGRNDVFESLKEAVKLAQQSVTSMHSKAIHSAHKDALYRQVLLACAVAAASAHDPLGYFNPSALVQPLETILKRHDVQIATFSNHLSEFCQEKRDEVLERTGETRAYRFRFRDPLLVPFVFMDAIANGLVSDEQLSTMLGSEF